MCEMEILSGGQECTEDRSLEKTKNIYLTEDCPRSDIQFGVV